MAKEKSASAKGGLLNWLLWGMVGLLAMAAGAAVPFFAPLNLFGNTAPVKQKEAYVKFDDVIVNVKEGNGTRFVKVKMLLAMNGPDKEMNDLVNHHRPRMKDRLIGYLSNKSLKELQGEAAQNRIRREIMSRFNAMITSRDDQEKISDILFDEFQIGL